MLTLVSCSRESKNKSLRSVQNPCVELCFRLCCYLWTTTTGLLILPLGTMGLQWFLEKSHWSRLSGWIQKITNSKEFQSAGATVSKTRTTSFPWSQASFWEPSAALSPVVEPASGAEVDEDVVAVTPGATEDAPPWSAPPAAAFAASFSCRFFSWAAAASWSSRSSRASSRRRSRRTSSATDLRRVGWKTGRLRPGRVRHLLDLHAVLEGEDQRLRGSKADRGRGGLAVDLHHATRRGHRRDCRGAQRRWCRKSASCQFQLRHRLDREGLAQVLPEILLHPVRHFRGAGDAH